MNATIRNTVIVGSGPAGCTAAVYAARAGLEPVLLTGPEPGGQLITTPEIGNWPGASDNPAGIDLMEKLQQHAKDLGTEFLPLKVTSSRLLGDIKELSLDDGSVLKSRTVIVATGATARYLGLESESRYKGKGVSACATCDGFFFRKKPVAVIGGGSAAFVEALFLTGMCQKVYLVHRREGFRAEKVLIDRLRSMESDGRVEMVLNAVTQEVLGDGSSVTGLKVLQNGQERVLDVKGVFVAIGHHPETEAFADLRRDQEGYIVTGCNGSETSTSAAGVFAAGDCADRVYRQAITSAGQGCKAALDVEHYLMQQR